MTDIYIHRQGKQLFKPANNDSAADIIFRYRSELIELQLKIVEMLRVRPELNVWSKNKWDCTKHGHTFDVHEAICPKCNKEDRQEMERIKAENKHIKSLIKSIIGEVEL